MDLTSLKMTSFFIFMQNTIQLHISDCMVTDVSTQIRMRWSVNFLPLIEMLYDTKTAINFSKVNEMNERISIRSF